MKRLVFVVLLICAFGKISAQNEVSTIFTDRPNATDATGLLDPGDFQIEMGVLSDNNGGDLYTTAPNVSIKYGLLNWLELRVLTNFAIDNPQLVGSNNIDRGFTPITLTPKFKILEQDGFLAKLSATAAITLPGTGSPDFDINDPVVSYRILMENSLSDRVTWNHSLGTDFDAGGGDPNWAWSSAISFGITDKFGAFTELYGSAVPNSTPLYWDGGLSYNILNTLVIDAMIGAGLNNDASDLYLSFGFGWKTNFKKN